MGLMFVTDGRKFHRPSIFLPSEYNLRPLRSGLCFGWRACRKCKKKCTLVLVIPPHSLVAVKTKSSGWQRAFLDHNSVTKLIVVSCFTTTLAMTGWTCAYIAKEIKKRQIIVLTDSAAMLSMWPDDLLCDYLRSSVLPLLLWGSRRICNLMPQM